MINFALALATLLTTATTDPSYQDLVFEAQYSCHNANPDTVKEELLWDLVKVEKKYNVPSSLKGMVLAASCSESGYNPAAKGDYRVIKNKRLPMAIGILQQWPWYEKAYGINRTKHVEAADAWMKHIQKKLHVAERKCGFKNLKKKWIAAWVTAIRYPKPEGRCYEKPRHLRILKKWHRNIKNSKNKEDGC
tara:strand:+ start:498 stop:1070 length:573 start_codon:yes stop_codon:yes gene_type:complete